MPHVVNSKNEKIIVAYNETINTLRNSKTEADAIRNLQKMKVGGNKVSENKAKSIYDVYKKYEKGNWKK